MNTMVPQKCIANFVDLNLCNLFLFASFRRHSDAQIVTYKFRCEYYWSYKLRTSRNNIRLNDNLSKMSPARDSQWFFILKSMGLSQPIWWISSNFEWFATTKYWSKFVYFVPFPSLPHCIYKFNVFCLSVLKSEKKTIKWSVLKRLLSD